MPAQSTMEGFAKMMAAGAVVKGGIGGINKQLAKVGLGSKEAKTEAMYERRQKRLKKEKRDEIFGLEVELAEKHARANGSMLQAIKDGYAGRERINDIEQAHAEALREQYKKEIEEGDAITSQDYAGKKKANADRFAGNKTEQEWFWGNQKRQEALDRKRLKDEESAYKDNIKWESDAIVKSTEDAATSPTVNASENNESGGSVSVGGTAGFGGVEIISAIEDQTGEIITGLGTHSPPFLETLLKNDEDSPSIDPESIGAAAEEDYTRINGTSDVTMESMLDGEPLPMHADQLEELLAIEREELDYDRRREAREIKADRRALEDRRDSKFSKLKMGGFGRGGKKPDKKKGGGLMNMLMKFGAKWLLPIGALTGGWLGMKSVLGLSTKGDDAARLAKALKAAGMNADDAARLAQLKNADDAARALQHTDDIKTVGTKADDVIKKGAKGANVADDFVKAGTKLDKLDEGLKAGAKSTRLKTTLDLVTEGGEATKNLAKTGAPATNLKTNLKPVVEGIETSAKSTTKTLGGRFDNLAKTIKNLPKATSDFIKTIKGGTTGVKTVTAATNLANVTDAAMDAPDLLKTAGKTQFAPGMNPNSKATRIKKAPAPEAPKVSVLKKVTETAGKSTTAVLNTLDKIPGGGMVKASIQAGQASTMATTKAVGTVISKLATGAARISKYLAPLDVLGKMDQGQGFFESMGNMVLEVGNLAVGGADWIAEKGQQATGLGSGKGFMDRSGADFAFQTADIFGNEEKWDTHAIEKTINYGMAKWTGTEQVANKKVYTEEQKELANALEDAGVVDVGLGPGDIEDLEKLSLLDAKSLQALLDYQVWDDEDQKQITDLLNAKKMGITATYDDNGVFGSEKINYGDAVEEQTAEQKAYTASLDPAKRPDMKEYKPEGEGMFSGFTDTFTGAFSDIFSHFSPDPVKQTKMAETTTLMAENATEPGSIFTHDTHLEKTLWDIWGEEKTFLSIPPEETSVTDFAPQLNMFGNQPNLMAPVPVIDVSPNAPVMGVGEQMMPSELLAQVVSQISTMEKQNAVGSSGGTNVNSVTNTNNAPVVNQIAAQPTAHGPITPGTNR